MSAIRTLEDFPVPPGQVQGPAAWYGPALEASREWVRPFSEAELAELHAALLLVKDKRIEIAKIQKEDFPLPVLGPRLDVIRRQLLDGCGFVLLRGLPVDDYTIEEVAIIYYGLGMYFGVSLPQNTKGHVLGHVKDLGYDHTDPTVRIYQTTARQTFHTDPCDFVALLCLKPAMKGGLSSIVSSVTVYNEMVRRRPDLAKIMFQPIESDRRGDARVGERGYHAMPICNWFEGRLSTLYHRTYIESARRFEGVPEMTSSQRAALDFFDTLANDPALKLDMRFEPGDIQILHNYQILHDRTDYEDWPEPERKRHLLRLWLSAPDGHPLPETFAQNFGSIEIGSPLRGFMRDMVAVATAPLDAE